MPSPSKKLALVLSGGGARGAYEAGVLHYIRTKLPAAISKKRVFDILCGSSVGAINTCFVAATSHNLDYQGAKIFELWRGLQQGNIYRRDPGSMARLLGKTFTGVYGNLFRMRDKNRSGTPGKKSLFRGLLDTSPFPFFLKRTVPWGQIALNIQNGVIQAISLTATNVHTGKTELFINKHPDTFYSGDHLTHFTTIEPRHALASAAIPLLFPTVRIANSYYCDGGLRLNTPLSPAIQLGANKVLVIGLHHFSERSKQKPEDFTEQNDLPPTMGELLGQILKSVFLDRLDFDLKQMNRLNQIIEWCEKIHGPHFLDELNRYLLTQEKRRDIAERGLKKLSCLSIFPSMDIRELFTESVSKPSLLEKGLSRFEKLLLKMLDVDVNQGRDFLSFMLFIPAYIDKMLELGFNDAQKHHDRLVSFFEEN